MNLKTASSGIFKDSLKTGGMTIVQLLTSSLAGIMWARMLGPSQLGYFAFFVNICSVSVMAVNPSLYSSASFYISSKKYSIHEIWFTLLIISGVLSLISFLIVVIGSLLLLKEGPSLTIFPILVLFINVFFAFIYGNFSGVMYGGRRVTGIAGWNTLSSTLYLVGTIVIILILQSLKTANLSWIYPLVWFSIIQMLNALALMFFTFPRSGCQGWNPDAAKDLIKYGAAVYPGRIATYLNYRVDTFFIMSILGSYFLGIYSVATTLAELVWQVPGAISLVMLPGLVNLPKEEGTQKTIVASRYVTTFAVLSACGLSFFSYWIIRLLYGFDFLKSQPVLFLLLPGIITFAVCKIIEPFFQSIQKPNLPSIAAILGLFINILANIVLIRKLGIEGAAVASSISYTAQVVFLAYLWQKETSIPWWKLFVPIAEIPKRPSTQME